VIILSLITLYDLNANPLTYLMFNVPVDGFTEISDRLPPKKRSCLGIDFRDLGGHTDQ
jgi:hypothetical protein